jgi:hypothetical protein
MYDGQSLRAEQAEPLSARNPLKHNGDGSVDLYLQASSPGAAKEANWLPTTQSGKFIPMLRLYWPKETPPFDPRRHVETAAGGPHPPWRGRNRIYRVPNRRPRLLLLLQPLDALEDQSSAWPEQ